MTETFWERKYSNELLAVTAIQDGSWYADLNFYIFSHRNFRACETTLFLIMKLLETSHKTNFANNTNEYATLFTRLTVECSPGRHPVFNLCPIWHSKSKFHPSTSRDNKCKAKIVLKVLSPQIIDKIEGTGWKINLNITIVRVFVNWHFEGSIFD